MNDICTMFSKAKVKIIQSLLLPKFRQKYQLFVVETPKIVLECIKNNSDDVVELFALAEWADTYARELRPHRHKLSIVSENELKQLSFLQTPQSVVALCRLPTISVQPEGVQNSLSLVLETIQDPGNMGTILRIADWFGLPYLFCSPDCVDVFNPKTIQASMGAFLRVKVVYLPLNELLDSYKNMPVYGTVLGGENIYTQNLPQKAFIVIGNEGKGISPALQMRLHHRLTIPAFGGAESLNAAVATGIVVSEFKRNSF